VSASPDQHQLDDYDRAAFGVLIQAVEMQPNGKSRELTEPVTKLVEFLETQSVVSFLGARVLFNNIDAKTKGNIRRDAKRLALQLAADPDIHARLESLMTRLRERKKPVQPSRPGLLGAINRT